MTTRTHYAVLGIRPDASDQEVRDAFRRLARQHHPDRSAAERAGADRMAEINEAYRVLSDPSRRAVYDASLRRSPAEPSTAPEPADEGYSPPTSRPADLQPARIPWRMLTVVGVIAIVGIVVLAQFTEPGEPDGPDGIMRVGDCVEIELDNDAREVACTGDVSIDLVVRAFVPFEGRCPGVTRPHRDRQGMGIACVEVAASTGSG
ncbi:MAG: J domain-containing protein [Actinomycetota bacterium]